MIPHGLKKMLAKWLKEDPAFLGLHYLGKKKWKAALPDWIDLSCVLKEVSKYVRETAPGWFDEHVVLFNQQTDGMFNMEYTEEEFAERLYDAIEFLGRNFGCRLTDTEAMNVVEVMKEVQEICNGSVKIYSCNGHTTSKVAAGMVFLSFGVVAASRVIHKPTKHLGKKIFEEKSQHKLFKWVTYVRLMTEQLPEAHLRKNKKNLNKL